MNALSLLFLINEIEGDLSRTLIDYRKKLKKMHGLVNMYYLMWEPDGGKPFTARDKSDLHGRIKSLNREISMLLRIARSDKKYG